MKMDIDYEARNADCSNAMPTVADIESYNGVPHPLDNCHNDGMMWRTHLNPSALSGEAVECLIPVDDEFKEGDLIPNYFKWLYDRYVESEHEFKEIVATSLLQAATARGFTIEIGENPTPDRILGVFSLSLIFLLDPIEEINGHVELSWLLGHGFIDSFDVVVSLDPPGAYVSDIW